jgi:hypothetical protein
MKRFRAAPVLPNTRIFPPSRSSSERTIETEDRLTNLTLAQPIGGQITYPRPCSTVGLDFVSVMSGEDHVETRP